MTGHIPSYSPNMRHGRQVIQLTLMSWSYKSVHTVEVSGNLRGMDAFNAAVYQVYESLLPRDEDDLSPARLVMKDDAGKELEVVGEDDKEEDFLHAMLVDIRVLRWDPRP
jgi:hypothetical protein